MNPCPRHGESSIGGTKIRGFPSQREEGWHGDGTGHRGPLSPLSVPTGSPRFLGTSEGKAGVDSTREGWQRVLVGAWGLCFPVDVFGMRAEARGCSGRGTEGV